MSRHVKQIIYSVIYLFIIGLVGTGFYLKFKPAPSCFDLKQNQNEEGIDCGFVCGNICLPQDFKPLQIVDQVRVFYPTRNTISLLAKIQNLNQANAAKSFKYIFKIIDNSGNELQVASEKSFIYAGDIKYLAVFNIPVTDVSKIKSGEISIEDPTWVRTEEFMRPQVAVQDQNVSEDVGGIIVKGKLSNRDTVNLTKVTAMVIFYGSHGQAAGVSQTEIDNVLPGETRSFTIAHPSISGVDLNRTQIVTFSIR
jgi:hypothetical protein